MAGLFFNNFIGSHSKVSLVTMHTTHPLAVRPRILWAAVALLPGAAQVLPVLLWQLSDSIF